MTALTDTDRALDAASAYFGEGTPDPLLWATFIAGYLAGVCDASAGDLRETQEGRQEAGEKR